MNDSAPLPPHPKAQKMPIWLIVLLTFCALLVVAVPFCGVGSVLGIYGVRKYIATAKAAEARNTLADIAKRAALTYEQGGRLCPSTTHPVPIDAAAVSGAAYQSTPADWEDSGFACLGFSLERPQYYQYSYVANDEGFEATARGDLDGDGVFSTFTARGRRSGTRIEIQPNLEETNPLE